MSPKIFYLRLDMMTHNFIDVFHHSRLLRVDFYRDTEKFCHLSEIGQRTKTIQKVQIITFAMMINEIDGRNDVPVQWMATWLLSG